MRTRPGRGRWRGERAQGRLAAAWQARGRTKACSSRAAESASRPARPSAGSWSRSAPPAHRPAPCAPLRCPKCLRPPSKQQRVDAEAPNRDGQLLLTGDDLLGGAHHFLGRRQVGQVVGSFDAGGGDLGRRRLHLGLGARQEHDLRRLAVTQLQELPNQARANARRGAGHQDRLAGEE
eukprot:4554957-Prymnesium_polylepis.2